MCGCCSCRRRWAMRSSSRSGCKHATAGRSSWCRARERKVPLDYRWVGDMLLTEQLEKMAEGDEPKRYTPALVFCFNRDECWNVAELLKGKSLLADGQQKRLADELAQHDWSRRGRAEAEGDPAARRRRASRGRAAEVSPHRRRAVPAEAAVGLRLHRDAGGGHQPAGAQRRAADAAQGQAGRDEGDRRQHGPSDFRPRGPAAVRQAGLRVRPGPRGRREDPAGQGEVRPDSRGHEGPGPAADAEGPEAQNADAPQHRAVLDRAAVGQAAAPRRR